MLLQRPHQADCHEVIGAYHRFRAAFRIGEKGFIGHVSAVQPHGPMGNILLLIYRQSMQGHFLFVNLQSFFSVRMSFISGKEHHPLQSVILQQMLHQRADCQVFVCIHTVVFVFLMSD